MPCEHYKDALIEAAAAGAAPQGELRAHLDECASCGAAFDEEQSLFAAIDSGLHSAANTEVPVSLLPRVRASLEDAVAPKRPWMQPFVLASAGVALAFLLLFVVRSHGPVPSKVAKQTPATSTPKAPLAGTHKDISPSTVQVASTSPNHSHTPRTSTVMCSAAASNPEVLVPPDEREAFARFVAVLGERRELALALVTGPPQMKEVPSGIEPFQINGLEIKPLDGAELEQSSGAEQKQ